MKAPPLAWSYSRLASLSAFNSRWQSVIAFRHQWIHNLRWYAVPWVACISTVTFTDFAIGLVLMVHVYRVWISLCAWFIGYLHSSNILSICRMISGAGFRRPDSISDSRLGGIPRWAARSYWRRPAFNLAILMSNPLILVSMRCNLSVRRYTYTIILPRLWGLCILH